MGMALGCLIFTLLSIINLSLWYDSYISDFTVNYVKYSIMAMVIGVGFTIPTMVYGREDLSRHVKILIHIGTGMTVYTLAGFYEGFIPASLGISALIMLLLGIGIAFVIWFGFYLLFRKEALKINKQIKKMN